jgi:Tol biopolymer transport system component
MRWSSVPVVFAAVSLLLGMVAPGASARPRNGAIAYVASSPQELFTVRVDGGPSRALTRPNGGGPTYPGSPEWSPRGRTLVTVTGSMSRIETISADGRRRRTVPVAGVEWLEHPTWSADGKAIAFAGCARIVFTDIDECARHAVYRVAQDGSDLRQLAYGAEPTWSADGRVIAFRHEIEVAGEPFGRCYELALMAPDGSDVRRVAAGPEGGRCMRDVPQGFTPDGRGLVVSRSPHIYTVRLDGSGSRRLIKAPRGRPIIHAQYSPDGRHLAWIQPDPQTGGALYTRPAAGGKARRIKTRAYVAAFDWQPLP